MHTRRGSATPHPGGSPFPCTLFMVQPSCEAIRRCRAGDFALCGARERAARAAGAKKGWTPTVSTPLLNLPVSLCSQVGVRNGFAVPICARDRKKRTAVPLPPHRPQSAIPFTAALKPLELCYTQLRKTRAICRDNAATMRKTWADTRSFMRVTYEVGPQGPFARLPRER